MLSVMSERKINLEKIILEAYGCNDVCDFINSYNISVQMIKEICIEACRQTLELAAEKINESIADLEYDSENKEVQQSIFNTINQIE